MRRLISMSMLGSFAMLLNACGGGGGGSSTILTPPISSTCTSPQVLQNEVCVTPAVVATTVTINSSSASAYQGDSVTLTWSSANATSCTASGGWSGTLPTSGSQAVIIMALGVNSYSLRCDNASISINVSSTIKPYFTPIPTLLPDVRPYYTQLCGNDVNVQSAVAINLSGHKDGKKDLLFTLWCSQPVVGRYVPQSTPVLNTIVALIQQPNGSFMDGTSQVFGSVLPDLGGIASSPIVADLNGDGLPDVSYLISREDGRGPDPSSNSGLNNSGQKVVILSKGKNSYSIIPYGLMSWWSGQFALSKGSNPISLLSLDYFSHTEVFGFGNSLPKDLLDTSLSPLLGLRAIAALESNESDTAIVQPTSGSLSLFRLRSDGWKLGSTWSLPGLQFVPWLSWQKGSGTVPLAIFDGETYAAISFPEGCFMRISPQQPHKYLSTLWAYNIKGGYQGGVVDESSPSLSHYVRLLAFSLSDPLTNIPIGITGEIRKMALFQMRCNDLNGDGFEDIAMLPWGPQAKPVIYLNNRAGGFRYIDEKIFPSPNAIDINSTMILEDIDGDGIRDLVYWSLTGVTGQTNGAVNFLLYKGLRNLD